MKNIAIITGLLLGGFWIALWSGAGPILAGRIGIAAVFGFTAVGHFVLRAGMEAMLPAFLPARSFIVLFSGVIEVFLAVLVLVPSSAKLAGIAICVFLVVVTPANVCAAVRKIDFGGHGAGPRYLLVRLPLQVLLLAWTWWFAVRPG